MSTEPLHHTTLGAAPGAHPHAQVGHAGPDQVVHAYDDIEEYDNQLPRWWLFILYATITFAVVYWFDYHVIKAQPSQREAFDQDMAADYAAAAERARRSGAMTNDALLALSRDPATLAAGRATFQSICVACHRADGGGNIGPNLTDAYWLHGGQPTQIFHTVMEGVPSKGMAAWGPQLGDRAVQSVVAYVLTLRNTNVPGGKAPQGEREAP